MYVAYRLQAHPGGAISAGLFFSSKNVIALKSFHFQIESIVISKFFYFINLSKK